MCFTILDQVNVLESCLCSILVYVLEIDECDLIVFGIISAQIGIISAQFGIFCYPCVFL